MHSLRLRPVFRMKSLYPRFKEKSISSNSKSYSFDNPSFILLKPNLNQLFSRHLQHKSTLFKHQHKTHQPTFSWFVYISPSVDEDGEIIEFFDSDQWQEHQASIATSTALASAATASPEAADQQRKRARRIAHPSDPLKPSPPEIVPVQPGRMLRRIRTASYYNSSSRRLQWNAHSPKSCSSSTPHLT